MFCYPLFLVYWDNASFTMKENVIFCLWLAGWEGLGKGLRQYLICSGKWWEPEWRDSKRQRSEQFNSYLDKTGRTWPCTRLMESSRMISTFCLSVYHLSIHLSIHLQISINSHTWYTPVVLALQRLEWDYKVEATWLHRMKKPNNNKLPHVWDGYNGTHCLQQSF